jgi:hypothetical protein
VCRVQDHTPAVRAAAVAVLAGWLLRASSAAQVSFLGDAKSSLGDAKS